MTALSVSMPQTLAAWRKGNASTLREAFIAEASRLQSTQLPLQAGLARSSVVADSPFSVVLITAEEDMQQLRIKAGIFYAGIIAGCSCADDPTPVDEITEYCEVLFSINKANAETLVVLLD